MAMLSITCALHRCLLLLACAIATVHAGAGLTQGHLQYLLFNGAPLFNSQTSASTVVQGAALLRISSMHLGIASAWRYTLQGMGVNVVPSTVGWVTIKCHNPDNKCTGLQQEQFEDSVWLICKV